MSTEYRKYQAKVLKDSRISAGLRQTELAARLGKDQSYVSRVESGVQNIDFFELLEYGTACEANLTDLATQLVTKRIGERLIHDLQISM